MSVADKIKARCLARGANGIRGLQRQFKIMDDNHSLTLSPEEFRTGLSDYGVDLSDAELQEALAYFDSNGDGHIDVNEFFIALKGGLQGARKQVVRAAFFALDSDRSGTADLHDIRGRYDVSKHPKLISGEMSEDDILLQFLQAFDDKSNPDGKVTLSEFEAYYAGISAGVDDDEHFELIVKQAWQLDDDEIAAAADALDDSTINNGQGTASAKQAAQPRHRDPPKRIVGYTGHVPGAAESYGASFDRTERLAPNFGPRQRLPEAPKECVLKIPAKGNTLRPGWAANQHNYKLQ